MNGRASPIGMAAAVGAMVGWAASGVMAKGIDLGGLAVVTWRMLIYSVLIVGFQQLRGQPLTRRALRIALPGGIALGLDLVLFFTAVKLTTVANATVIGAFQPVLMLGLARPLFGEQPRRTDWLLAAVAIGGAALVVFGSSGSPEWNIWGDLLSIATLVAWTGYFIFSRLTRDRIDAFEYTAATAVIALLVGAPLALVSGQLFELPTTAQWGWLALLAVGPGFSSHLLMNWAIGRVPVWLASTLTLFIPVASSLMAWVFLDEAVVALQLGGMAVVIVALSTIVLGQANGRPDPDEAATDELTTDELTTGEATTGEATS